MKMGVALDLVTEAEKPKNYLIHFGLLENGVERTDYIPEGNEPPFITEVAAWEFAERFAKVDPKKYINIFVVDSRTYVPVKDYSERKLNVR